MNNKLRATPHSGAAAITDALAGQNLTSLAEKLGLRKPTRLQELAFSENPKPATTEELCNLCAVISKGIFRYVPDDDAIVTDATNALRASLLTYDLGMLVKNANIPLFLLERFSEAIADLSVEQLDELVLHLFPGMKIDHKTNTLVLRGYLEHATSELEINRNPLQGLLNPKAAPPVDPSSRSNERPRSIGVFAPVAKGSPIPDIPVLKMEPKHAGYDRMMAMAKTTPGMLR